ncbi:E3 ubiquitin/ISG15 ligase TRIM25 [Chanos chanos]|uniref:E3 ubiquitin/ISG15 ligase TRIM25 n=1 Tax=Chanos chanos TaxID=29144 RepID=A0A6J2V4B6_CHACN|nr:E3 ubiquitin/ISG15 ligase TRIM25-like [Chanos chanos]
MSEALITVSEDQFSCVICLDLLKDPVTIPCGHSYCMECIKGYWDGSEQGGVYSCPQCRQTFSPRPALNKNTMFAEVVEKLRDTGLEATDPIHDSAQGGDRAGDLEAFHSCQRELGEIQKKCQQRIQEREQELDELTDAMLSLKCSSLETVEDCDRIFSELAESVEKRHSELVEMIRAKEQAELKQGQSFMEQLKQEITELKNNVAELKKLSDIKDHAQFLQSFRSLGDTGFEASPGIIVNPDFSFNMVKSFLSPLKEQFEDLCQQQFDSISKRVKNLRFIPTPEPKTREQFLEYSGPLTLDVNTAHRDLCLSEGNREVTFSANTEAVPDHPERFEVYYQVLCRESVCGRCYFEVEWMGEDGVNVGVSYDGIGRKGGGEECVLGHNDQSWCLTCSPTTNSFLHNSKQTEIPAISKGSRVGVYLDHKAGILCFYSVLDTMTFLHRIQTTFTEPLYPGFRLGLGSTMRICYPL